MTQVTQTQTIGSGLLFLNKIDLGKILPHTGPAQPLDGAEYDYSNPDMIITRKLITNWELMLPYHFPGRPVYRGVDLIELVNLSAAVLIHLQDLSGIDGLPFSKRIKEFEFLRAVTPGVSLEIETVLKNISTEKRSTVFTFSGRISNQHGKLMAFGEIAGISG